MKFVTYTETASSLPEAWEIVLDKRGEFQSDSPDVRIEKDHSDMSFLQDRVPYTVTIEGYVK